VSTFKNGVAAGVVALVIALSGGEAKADGIPLGIVIADTPTGVMVTDVLAGGIADRFMPRLKPGAHIIDLNGAPVTSAEQFRQVLLSSNFVRFHFVDTTGERRWANAWSGGHPPLNCRP
jgi:S1-C subfamily serine protease